MFLIRKFLMSNVSTKNMIFRLAEGIARGENFGECLERILKEKGVSPAEFARRANIPRSTLYKILNGENPRYETLSKIFSALYERKKFAALIAARYVLEGFSFDQRVKVYPASTLEDVIISAVRAEKEGAGVIICAPIISGLIEKIVDIPVVTIKPRDSIVEAVNVALEKL